MPVEFIIRAGLGGLLLALIYRVFRAAMAVYRRHREFARRVRVEDALKHIHARQQSGHLSTPASLAGSLHLSMKKALRLVLQMEQQGLLESTGPGLRLTPTGQRLTLQVVRAHRLWERYLADEAGMGLRDIHHQADKHEHELSPAEADALEVQMGYPRKDPHGDPIPSADGELAQVEGRALCDWPVKKLARIVHIEDEPQAVYRQIVALGLKPGAILEILETSTDRMVITDGEEEYILAPLVAANIQVSAARRHRRPTAERPLAVLEPGQKARVARLSEELAGLTRRRLLDLGITPGTMIEAALKSAFGGLAAYRVRGSLIALRQKQTQEIFIFLESNGRGQTR